MVDDNVAVVEQTGDTSHSNRGLHVSRQRIITSNIQTVEVTSKFKSAAAKLRPGTLIKDDYFTLFESVGALEIGDPKMDSGCDENQLDAGLDFDVTRNLEQAEVLWLMDELFCREVSWQMGYPLSQTLFTSYHVDSLLWPEPSILSDAQFRQSSSASAADPLTHLVFRAYCLALLKCCDLTLTMVTSQHYYEEEDFASQLFNRDLLKKFSVDSIVDLVQQATQWLDQAQLKEDFKAATLSHMDFRKSILEEFARHAATTPSTRIVRPLDLDALRYHQAKRQPVDKAFSPTLQRRLTSSVPPRPMITAGIEEALSFWHVSCKHMSDAFAVRAADNNADLLVSYLLFSSQHPQPSAYVRALLQSFLTQDSQICGRHYVTEFLANDLRQLTLTSSPLILVADDHDLQSSTTQGDAWKRCVQFLTKIEVSYTNIFRALCLNRSRLRRTLCHAVLEWDQIQAEAEDLDDEIQNLVGEAPRIYVAGALPTYSYAVSSWVYHFKLTQLRLLVQMGFELSVYAPHEMAGMYWYLAHICDTHQGHLERISHFVASMERNLSKTAQPADVQRSVLRQCQDTTHMLYRHFSHLKATEALSKALHGLYVVIAKYGLDTKPSTTYSSDQLRYEIRMRPFLHLSVPEPISFQQFQKLSSTQGREDLAILETAAEHAKIAKRTWEEISKAKWHTSPLADMMPQQSNVIGQLWAGDIRDCVKASIAAGIAIDELRRRLEVQTDSQKGELRHQLPRREDRGFWHPFWIVPRIE